MPDRPHWNATDVANALRDARGIKSVAARRLGCSLPTIENYINRYPTVEQAFKEGRASIVDMAEGQLAKHLNAGYWPAVHFTLTTLGRDRGYGAQIDINLVIRQEVARIAERDGLSEDEAAELHDSMRAYLKAAR